MEHKDAIDVVKSDVDTILDGWNSELGQMSLMTNDPPPHIDDEDSHHYRRPTMMAMLVLHDNMIPDNLGKVVDEGVECLMSMDVENLNVDQ